MRAPSRGSNSLFEPRVLTSDVSICSMEDNGIKFVNFDDGEELNEYEKSAALFLTTSQPKISFRSPDNRYHGGSVKGNRLNRSRDIEEAHAHIVSDYFGSHPKYLEVILSVVLSCESHFYQCVNAED